MLVHDRVNVFRLAVFFNRSRHSSDNQIQMKKLQHFFMNYFVDGFFIPIRFFQGFKGSIAYLEKLKKLLKVKRIHLKRFQITDRGGF